jgi:Tol biopolymer transport system component/DNA-binding winged helix-turn-helix (wHTH) protein
MEMKTVGYQFSDVVVRTDQFEVLRSGQPIPLEPKSFKVLVYLIENRGRAVTKDELMAVVWAGTAVTDNALTRVIAQLRRELGDEARKPRYIETVPTVGYRFLAEVHDAGDLVRVAALPGEERPASSRNRVRWIWAFGVLQAVVIMTLTLAMPNDDDRPPRLQAIRQMTVSLGLDQHPAFSPDGSSIAFSSDRSGRFEIYVRPMTPGAREIQITSDGQQNLDPTWSPDGKFIAYRSEARNGIFVVPALGGVARRLTDFGSQPSWSPDGTRIAFSSTSAPSLVPIDLAPPNDSAIWIVPAAGGTPESLTKPHEPPSKHNFPSWSPDGKSVVFVSHLGGPSTIWSASVPGGALSKIRASNSGMFYPTYAADGKAIYFVAATPGGNGNSIWRLQVGRGEPDEVMPVGLALPRDLAIDRNGRRLAYSLQVMSSNIYSLNAEDGTARPLVDDRSFRNTLPLFSPDGERIAYLVQRFGMPGNIWLMDSTGANPTRLSQNDTAEWLTGWIDGGRSVAYGAQSEGRNSLWAVSLVDGSNSLRADLGDPRPYMRLSPDGKELLFHEYFDGSTNIWKMAVETKKTTQLTFGKQSMSFPAWSPDGEWIAFETWQGTHTFLTVIDRLGNRQSQLTHEAGHAWPYSWSPDGDRIAFAGMRDGAWNIWWVSKSTGAQKKLTNHTSFRSFVRYPAWSPKGNSIVYELAETKGNIYVAQLPD